MTRNQVSPASVNCAIVAFFFKVTLERADLVQRVLRARAAQGTDRIEPRGGGAPLGDGTPARLRKKVEMRFGHLKRNLNFRRLRLRGLTGAKEEFLCGGRVSEVRESLPAQAATNKGDQNSRTHAPRREPKNRCVLRSFSTASKNFATWKTLVDIERIVNSGRA